MVVRVKGAIKVVYPGGEILYIFAGPVARLTPLKMGVCRRLRLHAVETGEPFRVYPGDHADPGCEPSLERKRREGGEMLGEARGRLEKNEASGASWWGN